MNAWDFVKYKTGEWSQEDWSDFYHGVDGALKKIAIRHGLDESQLDSVMLADLPELLQAISEGAIIQAQHYRDDRWLTIDDWSPGIDFANYQYRRLS